MLQVYFDFDDTLVKTQVLFEESKRDCAHLIQQANPALSFEEIIGKFNAREAQNIKEHGLLSSRFGLSWTETYAHFLGSNEAVQAAIARLEAGPDRCQLVGAADAVSHILATA